MAATGDIKGLIAKAEQGDRVAALELARTYKCSNVTELLGVVCPLNPPSVETFDVCADAIALQVELAARKSPAPVLSRK